MSFYEIMADSFKDALIMLPFFVLFALVVAKLIFKQNIFSLLKIFFSSKNIDSKKNENNSINNIEIVKDLSDEEFFGLDELASKEEFEEDVMQIMTSVQKNETVKVPFAKAIYILKHFKSYNVFANEDGKIIFEKLKEIMDAEENITGDDISKSIEGESVKAIPEQENQIDKISDGRYKISNPNGYTIVENGVVVEAINYNEELKKAEDEKETHKHSSSKYNELQEKIDNIDKTLLDQKKEKGSGSNILVRDAVEKITTEEKEESENESNLEKKLSDDVNNLMEKFENIQTKKSENETNKKPEIKRINAEEEKEIKVESSMSEKVNKVQETTSIDKSEETNVKKSTEPKNNSNQIASNSDEDLKIENDVPDQIEPVQESIEKAEKDIVQSDGEENSIVENFVVLKLLDDKVELIEDSSNIIFILEDFEEKFKNNKENFIKSLLSPENLISYEQQIIFTDISLEARTLYVDVYIFIVIFSKFFENPHKLIEVFLNTPKAIRKAELKKILTEFNKIFLNEFGMPLFRFVGSRNSPFVQRNLRYTIEEQQIVSCQMLLLDLDFESELVQNCILNIKNEIISKFKPEVKKIKASDDMSKIKSIDLNNISI